jgi:uncharacterized protein (TIGR02246 family)
MLIDNPIRIFRVCQPEICGLELRQIHFVLSGRRHTMRQAKVQTGDSLSVTAVKGTLNKPEECMKIPAKVGAIALVLFFLPSRSVHSSPQLDHSADTKAIQAIEARWQDGWNRHDIAALADLFTEDADFVTVIGRWCKGKKDFYDYHLLLHKVMFKDSVWETTDTQIRFLKPDVAIVHANWGITGDRNADGTPRPNSRDGIFTQVMVKENGEWKISASQNTNIVPVPADLK